MCANCGCSADVDDTLANLQSGEAEALTEVDELTPPRDDGQDSGHYHPHHHAHDHGHDHEHGHPTHDGHDHSHGHGHHHTHGTTIALEKQVLAKNNQLAERNRGWLAGRHILALNLVSSPGAGKTTVLER